MPPIDWDPLILLGALAVTAVAVVWRVVVDRVVGRRSMPGCRQRGDGD